MDYDSVGKRHPIMIVSVSMWSVCETIVFDFVFKDLSFVHIVLAKLVILSKQNFTRGGD
jgi:hypothetical protein